MINWLEVGNMMCKPENKELLVKWVDKYGQVGHAVALWSKRGWRICTPWAGAEVDNYTLAEITHWAEVDFDEGLQ